VFIECFECAHELTAVLQCHSDAVVDVVQHFAAFALGWLKLVVKLN